MRDNGPQNSVLTCGPTRRSDRCFRWRIMMRISEREYAVMTKVKFTISALVPFFAVQYNGE